VTAVPIATHYQSGTQTRRTPTLAAAAPEAYAELHPQLAGTLGVADGGLVRLRTARGSAVVPARLSPGIRRDTVFVPFHWGGESRVNVLVSDALDPISRMPEFKTCPVAVEPATTPEDRAAHRSAAHLPA
jgi:assimilatory nitrate reductase catalytic subunit